MRDIGYKIPTGILQPVQPGGIVHDYQHPQRFALGVAQRGAVGSKDVFIFLR